MTALSGSFRLPVLASLALGSLLAMQACGDLELGFPGVSDPEGERITIHIPRDAASLNQKAFGDNPRLINEGDRVTWVNDDVTVHTVTASDGGWDSGDLQPGQRYTRSFDDPGAFPYRCKHHPNMTGTLEVQQTSSPPIVASPTPSVLPGTVFPSPSPTFP
ncbi:MAG: hypothetical protein NDJ90_14945 [Oligoflexia bacterium]|nr:hypothetical protein [Oligoflexia bacterium]